MIDELKNLLSRLCDLLAKLMSVKVLVLAVASYLAIKGKLDWYAWLACAGVVVGVRFWEKIKPEVKA